MSRAHKILDTWFKNREVQQRYYSGQNKPAETQDKEPPFDPDPPRKPIAKAGKYGQGYSTARHLARQGMKSVKEEEDLTHVVKKDTDDKDVKKKRVNSTPATQANMQKEAVDKEHPIYKEYQGLKKHDIKTLRGMIKQQHRIVDTSEFRTKEHAISHILHNKHGAHRMKAVFGESLEHVKIGSHVTLHPQMKGGSEEKVKVVGKNGDHIDVEYNDYMGRKQVKSVHHSFVKEDTYKMASKTTPKQSQTVKDAKETNHRQMNNLVHGREGGVHASHKTFRKEETEMTTKHGIGDTVVCKKTQRIGTVQGIEGSNYTVVYGDGSTDTGPADWWSCSCSEALKPEVKKQRLRDALERHTEKALAANKSGDHDAVKVHQQYMNKIKNQMARMSRNESVEDIFDSTEQQLDEISKQTLGSYVKKAAKDRGLAGMEVGALHAKSSLERMKKRLTGIEKATDKLTKEEVELNEAWSVNGRNPQRSVKIGSKVRSYDFPGMHDDHYVEGHVVGETPSSYHIKVGKVVRHGKEIPMPSHMHHVEAPKGKSIWTDAYAVHKVHDHKAEQVANPVAEPKGAAKTFSKVYGSRVRKGAKV